MFRKIAKYTIATYATLLLAVLIDSNLIGIKLFNGEVGIPVFWFAVFFSWTVPLIVAAACIIADWFRIRSVAP